MQPLILLRLQRWANVSCRNIAGGSQQISLLKGDYPKSSAEGHRDSAGETPACR